MLVIETRRSIDDDRAAILEKGADRDELRL
jgi:hypothetical protein